MKSNPKNALEHTSTALSARIKEKQFPKEYLIEIEFDEDEKNISAFECEKIN